MPFPFPCFPAEDPRVIVNVDAANEDGSREQYRLTGESLSDLSADQAFETEGERGKAKDGKDSHSAPPYSSVAVSPVTGLPRPTRGYGSALWMGGLCGGILFSALFVACSRENQKAADQAKANAAATVPVVAAVEIPPDFDATDPVRTVQWLIQESVPLETARSLSEEEQANNPLRKDAHNTFEAERNRWNLFVKGIVGREVNWPFEVKSISEEGIEIQAKTIFAEHVSGHRMPRYSGDFQFKDRSGKSSPGYFPISFGDVLSRDAAVKLNRGDWIRARCRIEGIELSSYNNNNTYTSVTISLEPPLEIKTQ